MKTMRIFDIRGLILILGAVLGVSAGFASPAFAQLDGRPVIVNPDGKVTYLGSGSLGGGPSSAYDINDSGQVVGSLYTGEHDRFGNPIYHAFITGPDGMGMTDLGTLGGRFSYAYGINDSGQVVGSSATADGSFHAFITGPNGMGMTDLGTLGGNRSTARDINDSGQVVGESSIPDSLSSRAFITGPDGMGMTALLGYYSQALGINDAGQVVGYSADEFGSANAFITGPNGMGMTDLGALTRNSVAILSINDSGQVAGNLGEARGFITGPNGMGMTELGTLGGYRSYAYGINDAGQVVGASETAVRFSYHAFITGPNGVGITDLNSIVDLPDGVFLSSANGINNLGQVIASMVSPIPEPASYALMLAGLGLVGFMARRKSAAGNTIARS